MNDELIKAQLIVLGWSYRNARNATRGREPDADWFWYHPICEDYRHYRASRIYPGYMFACTLDEVIEAVKQMTGIDLRVGEKVSGV